MRTRVTSLAVGAVLAVAVVVVAPGAARAAAPGFPDTPVLLIHTDATAYTAVASVRYFYELDATNGGRLSGKLDIFEHLPTGGDSLIDTVPVDNSLGESGDSPITVAEPGDYVIAAVFTSTTPDTEMSVTTRSSFTVRLSGASIGETHAPLVVGTAGSLAVVIRTPPGTAALDGVVHLGLDGRTDVATCTVTRTSGSGCSLVVPATIAAGAHAATLTWTGSSVFVTTTASETLTFAAARAADGSDSGGSNSGKSNSGGVVPARSASASASASAGGPTSTAAPAAGSPSIDPARAGATGLLDPLPILLAVIAVLIVAVIAIVIVFLVRSRRSLSP